MKVLCIIVFVDIYIYIVLYILFGTYSHVLLMRATALMAWWRGVFVSRLARSSKSENAALGIRVRVRLCVSALHTNAFHRCVARVRVRWSAMFVFVFVWGEKHFHCIFSLIGKINVHTNTNNNTNSIWGRRVIECLLSCMNEMECWHSAVQIRMGRLWACGVLIVGAEFWMVFVCVFSFNRLTYHNSYASSIINSIWVRARWIRSIIFSVTTDDHFNISPFNSRGFANNSFK